MRSDWNQSEPNWTRSASVYMYVEPFETDSGVYMRFFWIQSGMDPKLDLYCSGPVPKQSSVKECLSGPIFGWDQLLFTWNSLEPIQMFTRDFSGSSPGQIQNWTCIGSVTDWF